MKRIIAGFLAVLICSFFAGCSLPVTDINQLMSPPKPTGTRQQVQELIYNEAGKDIQYSYPRSGNYRSAIIEAEDLTGDGKTDVIGFYETPDDSGGITMIILAEFEGQWRMIAKYASVYTCVDRVLFGDLDGDGVKEAIVGWGSPVNQKGNICTYNFHENMIWEMSLDITYTEVVISDFMRNEIGEEMIVLELAKTEEKAEGKAQEIPATAAIYKIDGSRYIKYSEVSTNKAFVRYAAVNAGGIDKGTNGLILDGVKADNTIQTELIYWNDGTQRLFVYPPADESSLVNPSARSTITNAYAKDVNKDGFYEIPAAVLLPGIEEEKAVQTNYLISWNRFSVANQEYLLVMDTVTNSEYHYYLQIPEEWRDEITVKVSGASMMVYRWDSEKETMGEVLLKIVATPEEDYIEKPIQLAKQNGYIYAAELTKGIEGLSITEARLRECFNLLG